MTSTLDMPGAVDVRDDISGDLDGIDDVDLAAEAAGQHHAVDAGRLGTQEPRRDGEEGMATAEYAVGVIAACGFAGLVVKLLSSDDVMQILISLIQKAVSAFL